jgi:hypothetical protein
VGRRVLGINKYARVCRGWAAAGHGWDWEPLRFALDLDAAANEEVRLRPTIVWFSTHGQQVQHLSIKCYDQPSFPVLQQLWVAPWSFCSLVRLEVDGTNTLVNLAPLLPQLTKLQHLKASISLREDDDDCDGHFCTGPRHQDLPVVPVVQKLCPQLQGLHLVINSSSKWMDERLSQLLPCGLQQLQLEVVGVASVVHPAALAGCTALQQLMLQNLKVDDGPALDNLDHIQTICMVDVKVDNDTALSLKSKLLQYTSRADLCWGDPQTPGQLTALTSLTIRQKYATLDQVQLTSLRALQHLELVQVEDAEGSEPLLVLSQLAGLPQLRSLRLDGNFSQQGAAGLTALKQLTALYVSEMRVWCGPQWEQQQEVALVPQLLQQLPGLQQLEVHPCIVTECHRPWWTGLTALTQLMATWASSPYGTLGFMRDTVEAIKAGTVPASLQHLVFKAVPPKHEAGVGWNPPLCARSTSMLPGVTVTKWELPKHMLVEELPLPGTPCPWLPGVCEVPDPK